MTATTPRGYAYPELSDDFLPSQHIEDLAVDIDADVETQADRITALEAIAWQPFQVFADSGLTTTSSSAIGTSETVVSTIASTVYPANSLFRIQVRGGLTMSTTTSFCAMKIRKTNAAGTIVIEYPRTAVVGHTNAIEMPLKDRTFKTGGSNVTATLVFTLTSSSSSTSTHSADTTYPRGIFVYRIGPDTYDPHAVTLS